MSARQPFTPPLNAFELEYLGRGVGEPAFIKEECDDEAPEDLGAPLDACPVCKRDSNLCGCWA